MFLAVFYLMGGVALTDLEGLRSIAVAFLAIVCFYWVFYVGYLGGTSGMNWLGLRVLNFDGEPPTARSAGRVRWGRFSARCHWVWGLPGRSPTRKD